VQPNALQALITSAEGKPEERMVNYGLLRCMKQARYSGINLGHFGLASSCYTHFTSPIRRYPDLMVHRFLKLALAAGERPLTRQEQRLQAEMAEITGGKRGACQHPGTGGHGRRNGISWS